MSFEEKGTWAYLVLAPIIPGLARPADIGPPDVRDRDIRRFGEFVGGYVLAVGAVGVLALTMLELDHFWIANAIYLAFVAQAIVSSSVRLVAYRRGL